MGEGDMYGHGHNNGKVMMDLVMMFCSSAQLMRGRSGLGECRSYSSGGLWGWLEVLDIVTS